MSWTQVCCLHWTTLFPMTNELPSLSLTFPSINEVVRLDHLQFCESIPIMYHITSQGPRLRKDFQLNAQSLVPQSQKNDVKHTSCIVSSYSGAMISFGVLFENLSYFVDYWLHIQKHWVSSWHLLLLSLSFYLNSQRLQLLISSLFFLDQWFLFMTAHCIISEAFKHKAIQTPFFKILI